MALINCEECGKEYSNKSPSCPNCACPTPSPEREKREKIEDLKNKIDNHMVPCSACGDWNTAGTSYCKNCGNMYTGLDYIEFDEKLKSEGLIKESEPINKIVYKPQVKKTSIFSDLAKVTTGIIIFLFLVYFIGKIQTVGTTSDKSEIATDVVLDQEITETEDSYIHITSTELIDTYNENAVNCKQLYDKKMLAVTGSVQNIGEDILGDIYVSLGHDSEFTFVGIHCTAKDKETEDIIATLRDGDIITVRGIGNSSSLSFLLEKATIDQ